MVNTANVVIFPVVIFGENKTSEFPLGAGPSSGMLFLVEVKYRTEIKLKMVKIV